VYKGESRVFSAVSVAGMLIGKLKSIADGHVGREFSEGVVSVPGYWGDVRRRALVDAAAVGGLRVLRLVNEHAATALSYGLLKNALLSDSLDNPTYVMFADMGYAASTVSIVEFSKTKARVLATAYDTNLGGRDFDTLLAKHFAQEFKTKYKIDVLSNRKAYIRLEQGCEKLKKMLSSNPEAPLNIDSLMNDIDVRGQMTRKLLEEICAPLLMRYVRLLDQAVAQAGGDAVLGTGLAKLTALELIGGATRLLALHKAIHDAFITQRMGPQTPFTLSRTLNPEEATAKGCALQAAQLTPTFKVKEFTIQDTLPYSILIKYHPIQHQNNNQQTMDADPNEQVEPFPRFNLLPSAKFINLTRSQPFELVAEYSTEVPNQEEAEKKGFLSYPKGAPLRIASCQVPALTPPSSGETQLPADIRVKVKIDASGLLSFESIQLNETVFEEEKSETAPTNAEATKMETEKPADANATTPSTTSEEANANSSGGPAKKKKIRRLDLNFSARDNGSLGSQVVSSLFEEEGKMRADDRLFIETAERKCAVESYVYEMRNKINSPEYSSYATSEVKQKLLQALDAAEEVSVFGV
jgi:heat shock 70kDa protein 4